jgi:hypothetical protein
VYKDFCFPGRPPPAFILLAQRILSISANSASCERLFSVFGMTLTKLRSRLGTETLTSLAELKMHIRDENLQKDSRKRMKRHFGRRQAVPPPQPTTTVPTPIPIDPVLQTATIDTPSAGAMDVTPRHAAAVPNPPTPATESTPPASSFSESFRIMMNYNMHMVSNDNDDVEVGLPSSIIGRSVAIVELFDFGCPGWVDMYKRSAVQSFEEELELYELLDAEGEEEDGVDVDATMSDILHG